MKIAIEGLPATGRVISFGLRDGWAADAASRSLDRPATHLDGTIGLKRAGDAGAVIVDVRASASAPAACDRCGEPCEVRIDADTRLLYAPGVPGAEETSGAAFDGIAIDDPSAEEGEVTLESDDLDLGWYSGGELDLGDVVGEVLTLEAPNRVVCADSAECDKRTDALLAVSQGDVGPFAALRNLVTGRSRERED